MKKTVSFAAVLLATVALAAPSAAGRDWEDQGRGRGQAAKPNKPEQKSQKKADNDNPAFDRDRHVRVIRDYRTEGLPPGLAKRASLPPGLRKQLVERGELPPGLRKHLVDVPGPLVTRLPAVPAYYHRYFAGDDLIVVDTRTNRIVAIVRDVLR